MLIDEKATEGASRKCLISMHFFAREIPLLLAQWEQARAARKK